MPVAFTKEKLEHTSNQIWFYRESWNDEVPLRIHGFGVDEGHGLGGPPLHPEFEKWLGPICFCGRRPELDKSGQPIKGTGCPSMKSLERSNPRKYRSDARLRTTRAFRKLRKVAPREFDALYLMTAHHASFETALASLNDRAFRLGKPSYQPHDLVLLLVSGVDKADAWW